MNASKNFQFFKELPLSYGIFQGLKDEEECGFPSEGASNGQVTLPGQVVSISCHRSNFPPPSPSFSSSLPPSLPSVSPRNPPETGACHEAPPPPASPGKEIETTFPGQAKEPRLAPSQVHHHEADHEERAGKFHWTVRGARS